jgi:hypothetical protein
LSQTLFGEINPYGEPDEATSTETAGSRQSSLSLATIRPDPGQPRQLLPAELSAAVAKGDLLPAAALQQWLNQAGAPDSDPTWRHNIQELRRLSASVEQHGLINPITLRRPRGDETLPAGVEYLIVTGERRYWSHVLLALEGRQVHDGNQISSPEQIKALLTNEGVSIRAHQLIENLLREDINAVEKARGLWALRYELSGVNHGSPAPPGLEENLVNWGKIEEALDISKRYRIFVTSVLNLSEAAQSLVIRHNLSERLIRPIVQKLKERPNLQLEALEQLIAWRETDDNEPGQPIADLAQELVERLLARENAASEQNIPAKPNAITEAKQRSSGAATFRQQVQGALRFLNKLKQPDLAGLTHDLATTQEYAGVVEELKDLRERIDTILEAVSIYGASESKQ